MYRITCFQDDLCIFESLGIVPDNTSMPSIGEWYFFMCLDSLQALLQIMEEIEYVHDLKWSYYTG